MVCGGSGGAVAGAGGGAAARAGARDQPEDNEEDNEQDEEEEPNRTEEDDFLDSLGVVEDSDGLLNPEDAKLRRAVPGDGVEALGFGEDGEGGGVFFVGVDFFVTEEGEDLERVSRGSMDVTGVLN